jgi:glycosyltransferase involved in cell wall biosynthesis
VLAQSFQDFEVVVSDDSGDMAAVVEAFSDPRVRYHRNPRPDGQVANIVTSLGLARGRYLALLDDDDHWLPGFLDATVGVLERDPEIGIAFTDLYFEAGGRRLRRRATLAPGRQEGMLARILENCPVVMSAAVMRREVWEQGQREYPLEAGAVGDFTMWIRAALAGCGFHYVDESLACYALHPAQLSWDPRVQRRAIRLFERFEFEDPRCERLRRARLANARLATAGSHLWRGRLREARREIALARGVAPGRLGLRGWLAVSGTRPALVRLVASSPAVLMFVLRLWRALRPRVDPGARPQLERLLAGVEG